MVIPIVDVEADDGSVVAATVITVTPTACGQCGECDGREYFAKQHDTPLVDQRCNDGAALRRWLLSS